MFSISSGGELLVCQVPAKSPCQNLTLKIFAGGFTKSGNPLLILPDKAGFSNVTEGDLHLLLKYFISVVPKAEQVTKNHQKPIAKNFLFRVLALLWSLIEGAALYSKSRMSLTKLSCFFLLKSKRFSFCIITVKVKTGKKIIHFDKCPQYCRWNNLKRKCPKLSVEKWTTCFPIFCLFSEIYYKSILI